MTTETLDAPATTNDTGTQDATATTDTTVSTPAQSEPATAATEIPPSADAATEQSDAAEAVADYEPFATPEGMVANEELVQSFKAFAKEHKLSQQAAQNLVDMQGALWKAQADKIAKTRAEWAEAAKTDKEFGGDALAENIGVAEKALDSFATPQLRALLKQTGLSHHPEMIRAFVKIGKAISEDGRLVSGSNTGVPVDPAKRLFPNMK